MKDTIMMCLGSGNFEIGRWEGKDKSTASIGHVDCKYRPAIPGDLLSFVRKVKTIKNVPEIDVRPPIEAEEYFVVLVMSGQDGTRRGLEIIGEDIAEEMAKIHKAKTESDIKASLAEGRAERADKGVARKLAEVMELDEAKRIKKRPDELEFGEDYY